METLDIRFEPYNFDDGYNELLSQGSVNINQCSY